jgi:predicted RNA-binding Zn ribbon-like protein
VPLPSWVPPTETKPAPMPLLLVQAFVNSFEADTDTDLLRELDTARGWFAAAGLLVDGDTVDSEELRVARQVRESVRALLAVNAGAPPPSERDLLPLTTLAGRCQPLVRIDSQGGVHLETGPGLGLRAAWLRLLLIIRDAQADHTWYRLKACENDECGWAFYDRSHSRRGRWCDMAVCGNRMKNRSLRTRQRGVRHAAAGP